MFEAAYITPRGQLRRASTAPLGMHGRSLARLSPKDLIPLPAGAVISMMPDRVAIGESGPLPGAPAAALLPIGYTRTLLPAYVTPAARPNPAAAKEPFLPLFGYAALAFQNGKPFVAALLTDNPSPWQHHDPNYRKLRRLIRDRVTERPDAAKLLSHLAHCALDYECRSAQHIFYQEGEAALPSSPTCNAACVGCISEQPDPSIQPHERLAFVPDLEESVALAVEHLNRAENAIISFGQGCEGEPLLNRRNIAVIAEIRKRTQKGVINLNTNGSRPEMLRCMIDAGLDSIRVSMFSAREETFQAYYRPVRYGLPQVEECLRLAANHGLFTSVNLLTFPGITDDPQEEAALIHLYTSAGVDLVQLRNLNIDPDQLFAALDGLTFHPAGIRAMIANFRAAGLEIGSYTHIGRRRRGAPQTMASETNPAVFAHV